MSLTSYRTAPPRVKSVKISGLGLTGFVKRAFRCLLFRALGRPGGDLLSHALRRSTIGAEGFHDRVRDGIGCGFLAITTRSSKRAVADNGLSHDSGILNDALELVSLRTPPRAWGCVRV